MMINLHNLDGNHSSILNIDESNQPRIISLIFIRDSNFLFQIIFSKDEAGLERGHKKVIQWVQVAARAQEIFPLQSF
jgi:hypothetical protein